MKLLVMGDIHLGLKTDGFSRDEEIFNSVSGLIEFALTKGCQAVVILGDFFDSLHPTLQTIEYSVRLFQKMKDSDMRFFFVSGNHEVSSIEGHSMLYYLTRFIDNITVIERPMLTGNIGFYPYFSRYDEIKDVKNKADIHFSHLELIDFFNNKQEKLYSYKDFHGLFFSGHYHAPSNIDTEKIIVGSIIHTSFGEKDDEKRFILLDTDTSRWGSLKLNPIKLVELIVDVTDDENALDKVDTDDLDGKIVKVRLRMHEEQINSVKLKDIEQRIEGKALKCRGIVPEVVKKRDELDDEEKEKLAKLDNNQLVSHYIPTFYPDKDPGKLNGMVNTAFNIMFNKYHMERINDSDK